jgi:alpha-ketoglutarate-dependent taurine dioxygenase
MIINWDVSGSRSLLPLVGTPASKSASHRQLTECLLANETGVQDLLNVYGAILLRGFEVTTLSQFQDVFGIFCHEFNDYVGGNSPRTRVESHVFTATEYPKDVQISMHNEASYRATMPNILMFYCIKPAETGGQTPLADCRRVLDRIDVNVVSRFVRCGVRYVNNMHGGFGLGRSWMEVFGTTNKGEIEARLVAENQTFEWKLDGGLRTSIQAPAVTRHPITHENAWINQAEQWHPSSLDNCVREALMSVVGEHDLPHNAFFGDGSPLDVQDLKNVREAMLAEEKVFDWEAGDMLLCDNRLVMHGRRPYSGDRKVFVIMGN